MRTVVQVKPDSLAEHVLDDRHRRVYALSDSHLHERIRTLGV
jgi:hypothetical protein